MKTRELSVVCGIVLVAVFVFAAMPVSAEAEVISAGQYRALYTTLNSGDTWYFSVQADDVDVKVMDDDNFQIYSNNGIPYVLTAYSANSVSQQSFTISGVTGKIWIAIESNNWQNDQTINYESTITRYVPPSNNPPIDDTPDDGTTPGFDFPVIAIAAVVGVGIFAVVKRKKA